ncbi:MAG: hypothetical protein K2Q23_15460 [Bryobacteraceae bacterium]|nr:hypothetical protein [Bryobacteraceae bacterium]
MAEAFANAYGPDVMIAESAGLTPASQVSSLARVVMEEKGISLRAQKTRGFGGMSLDGYDLVINMTGTPLPGLASAPVVKALVRDPKGQDELVYRQVRDRIEAIVEDLIHMLRLARMEQHGIAHSTRPLVAAAGAA